MAKILDIVILSRNRPELLKETLESIVNQEEVAKVNLIVSENSTNEEVRHLLRDRFKNVNCIYRRPNLSAMDHYNEVISEITSPFFMIFHDDDLFANDFFSKVLPIIENDRYSAAIGFNAYLIRKNSRLNRLYSPVQFGELEISRKSCLAWLYWHPAGVMAFPFPSYVYRTKKVSSLKMQPEKGGKYCDVSFLLDVLDQGSIRLINTPIMYYRFHDTNDSATESVLGRMMLRNYLFSKCQIELPGFFLNSNKYKFWLKGYLSGSFGKKNWRCRVVKKYLAVNFYLLFSIVFIRALKKIGIVFP